MATEVLKTYSALQDELSKAREGLRSVDDNIKRIIGRDPDVGGPQRPGIKRGANQIEDSQNRGRGFQFNHGRGRRESGGVNNQDTDDGPPNIRRRLGEKTVFSRLSGPGPQRFHSRNEEDSGDEGELPNKPVLSSQVIVQSRELPSRQDILAAQGDERSKARNRRMFGALLGTLQKFRQEETQMREREDKRAQVEKRLEEAAKREKEELKKERQELFQDRKRKQIQIRRIEYKMQRIKEQDQWEARHRPLLNFIQTRTKPSIFYLPKTHNSKTEERLVASQKLIAKMMEKKRAKIHEEIEGLNQHNIKQEPIESHHTDEEEDMEADESNAVAQDDEVDEENFQENLDKENRLRSVNVKVEREHEQKSTLADHHSLQSTVEKPVVERREERHQNEHHKAREREPRNFRDYSKDKNREKRSRDREWGREREKEREMRGRNRERERDRDRGRERDRNRDRERDRGDREVSRDAKKEVEEREENKWNRKREGSGEVMQTDNTVESDAVIEDQTWLQAAKHELSSISLPDEVSVEVQEDQGISEFQDDGDDLVLKI